MLEGTVGRFSVTVFREIFRRFLFRLVCVLFSTLHVACTCISLLFPSFRHYGVLWYISIMVFFACILVCLFVCVLPVNYGLWLVCV